NGRVDALELFTYVHDNVKNWARSNRDALQTPVLLGDKDRAAGIELTVVKGRSEAPADEAKPFEPPPELASAWAACRRLQESVPAPWVYAPHLWRQYQDTLLRYEQLHRAGAADRAQPLKPRLDQLADEIGRCRQLDLPSAQNSLAMPFALGAGAPA